MTRPLHTLIHYLRHTLARPGDPALTDAQLLERWTGQGDSAAFELLVYRHGPMVLNTCRRLLPRREDAEDAFQATFLVLVRKADSIRRPETLPAWLHRIACRIALRARLDNARRTGREQPLVDPPVAPQDDEPALRDLHAIIEEEIDRLPAHYRRALVLCCLEGKTQEEAAQLLACPRGTVSSWLTRGRERLRQRLLRRGIVVSAAGLTAALTPDALARGGLSLLVASLIRVADGLAPVGLLSSRTIALAEGMLRMMLLTKVKCVTAGLFVLVVLASGVGTITHSMRAADPPIASTDKEQNTKRVPAIPPRLKEEQADDIAWGEKAHGLQAGIGFRPGDQTAHEVGQSITFVVYLRNVGDKEIRLSHIEPLFGEVMPSVEDADGNRFSVASGPINLGQVPILHRTLKPKQRIALGYPWFRIRPLGGRGDIVGPTCCAGPGKYKVGFSELPLRLNEDKTDVSGLATGRVEFSIGKSEAAKEDRSAKTAHTPVEIRALYQRAESQRRQAAANTIKLASGKMNPEAIEHFNKENQRLLTRAAEAFTKLEARIQDEELASLLTVKQREEIPFHLAECYYNLGEYGKALWKYEAIAKKWGKKKQALRAMGETIKCFALTNDFKGMKHRAEAIRGMLATTEGLTEAERRQWLEWLRQVNPVFDPFIPTPREEGREKSATTEPVVVGKEDKTDSPKLFYISARAFHIPICIDPKEREQTSEVILLFSKDQGQTYEQVERKPATERNFFFNAHDDGTFWFVVQQVDKQGRCTPANPSRVKATIKVCVDTTKPLASLIATGLREERIQLVTMDLMWRATDDNLDEKSITLEWAEKPDGPWEPIATSLLRDRSQYYTHLTMSLPSYRPACIHVRLRVKDKAGNETVNAQSVEIKNRSIEPPIVR